MIVADGYSNILVFYDNGQHKFGDLNFISGKFSLQTIKLSGKIVLYCIWTNRPINCIHPFFKGPLVCPDISYLHNGDNDNLKSKENGVI